MRPVSSVSPTTVIALAPLLAESRFLLLAASLRFTISRRSRGRWSRVHRFRVLLLLFGTSSADSGGLFPDDKRVCCSGLPVGVSEQGVLEESKCVKSFWGKRVSEDLSKVASSWCAEEVPAASAEGRSGSTEGRARGRFLSIPSVCVCVGLCVALS